VELANLTGPTLAEVIDQAHLGIERVRRTPHLAYSLLRRPSQARQLAGEVLASASARDLAAARVLAHRVLGLLELAAGRSEEALEHFRPMQDADGSVHPGIALQTPPSSSRPRPSSTRKTARPSRSPASPAWPRRPRPRTCSHCFRDRS
jgi:hypothetical protein